MKIDDSQKRAEFGSFYVNLTGGFEEIKIDYFGLMLFVPIAIVGLIAINTTSIINYNYIICSFGL